MSYCYKCDIKIIKQNKSNEHIIINAIGGRLKSDELLCKTCNSEFGNIIDLVLAKQLNFFMLRINSKRDRGKVPAIVGKSLKTGKEFLVEPNQIRIKNPKITIGENYFDAEFNNKKEENKFFKTLHRKSPSLDINQLKENVVWTEEPFSEFININTEIGGKYLEKAICKCAINFYIYKGGNKSIIKQLLPYIQNDEKDNIVFHHYKENIYNIKNNECFHTLYIVGNKIENILYAYIDYFNIIKYLVILNEDYQGDNICYKYQYDLINNIEINKKIDLNYSRKYIVNLKNTHNLSQGISPCLARFMHLAENLKYLKQTTNPSKSKMIQ